MLLDDLLRVNILKKLSTKIDVSEIFAALYLILAYFHGLFTK